MRTSAEKRAVPVVETWPALGLLLGLHVLLVMLGMAFTHPPTPEILPVPDIQTAAWTDLTVLGWLARAIGSEVASRVLALLMTLAGGVLAAAVGRGLCLPSPRAPVAGLVAGALYLFNPAVLRSATVYPLEASPVTALAVLLYLRLFLATDFWSTFMRSLVSAVAVALALWLYSPAALWIVLALLPWAIWHRRPAVALSIWLTSVLLGGLLYSVSGWMLHLVWLRDWRWIDLWMAVKVSGERLFLPAPTLFEMGGRLAEGGRQLLEWVSPPAIVLGVWTMVETTVRMAEERRTYLVQILAVLAVISSVLVLRGDAPSLALVAVWGPLVAWQAAQSSAVWTTGFRNAALFLALLTGFVTWRAYPASASTSWEAIHLWPVTIALIVGSVTARVFRIDRGLSAADYTRAVCLGGLGGYVAGVNVVQLVK